MLLRLKNRLLEDFKVVYVGCSTVGADPRERMMLLRFHKFQMYWKLTLSPQLQNKFCHVFCKVVNNPCDHYFTTCCHFLQIMEIYFDRSFWQAYVYAIKIPADKVLKLISPDKDNIWVHDYHLLMLSTFLRKCLNRMNLGFFLLGSFPSLQ